MASERRLFIGGRVVKIYLWCVKRRNDLSVVLFFLVCFFSSSLSFAGGSIDDGNVSSRSSVDFMSFVNRDLLDSPREFTSKQAENLWGFFLKKGPDIGGTWGSTEVLDSAEYMPIQDDIYLLLVDAFYIVNLKEKKVALLTSRRQLAASEALKIYLRKESLYAFVRQTESKNGYSSDTFYALRVDMPNHGPMQTYSREIETFIEAMEGFCGTSQFYLDEASRLREYEIKDVDQNGRADIIFVFETENCSTKKHLNERKIFIQ